MRRVLALGALCLMGAVGLLLWGFLAPAAREPARATPQALLLVDNDTGSYLMQLRRGLQESLQAQGIALRMERAGDVDLASPALYEGVPALYLHAQDIQALLKAMPTQRPTCILLGFEVRGEVCVVPDMASGGQQAGRQAALTAQNKPVYIVADVHDADQALRLSGALAGLGDAAYTLLSAQAAGAADWQAAGAALALDTRGTLALARLKQEGKLPFLTPLYGFDAPEQRVELMEDGVLQGVVAQNPYALGYQAGDLLLLREDGMLKPSVHLSPLRLVTPKTLYDAQHVKLMFPLLH